MHMVRPLSVVDSRCTCNGGNGGHLALDLRTDTWVEGRQPMDLPAVARTVGRWSALVARDDNCYGHVTTFWPLFGWLQCRLLSWWCPLVMPLGGSRRNGPVGRPNQNQKPCCVTERESARREKPDRVTHLNCDGCDMLLCIEATVTTRTRFVKKLQPCSTLPWTNKCFEEGSCLLSCVRGGRS